MFCIWSLCRFISFTLIVYSTLPLLYFFFSFSIFEFGLAFYFSSYSLFFHFALSNRRESHGFLISVSMNFEIGNISFWAVSRSVGMCVRICCARNFVDLFLLNLVQLIPICTHRCADAYKHWIKFLNFGIYHFSKQTHQWHIQDHALLRAKSDTSSFQFFLHIPLHICNLFFLHSSIWRHKISVCVCVCAVAERRYAVFCFHFFFAAGIMVLSMSNCSIASLHTSQTCSNKIHVRF